MTAPYIDEACLKEIFAHAVEEYPRECCGFVLNDKSQSKQRVIRCRNAQDRYHELDPQAFPRTAAHAFFMEPSDLLRIHKHLRQSREKIAFIYHSHPESSAAFSEEDQRMAAPEGEPAYPDVPYLVVSVRGKAASEWQIFAWSYHERRYVSA